jgi:hypothetical protein
VAGSRDFFKNPRFFLKKTTRFVRCVPTSFPMMPGIHNREVTVAERMLMIFRNKRSYPSSPARAG